MSSTDSEESQPDRENIVEIIALLDEVERRFHSLGKESMSIGPILEDVSDLQQNVVDRGIGYGVLDKSTPMAQLKHEALDVDIAVSDDGDSDD
jgi:hypothetical protein